MTDIYGTLGPSCADRDTLIAMLDAGMTGIRLNLSHSTLEESSGMLNTLYQATEESGTGCRLLIDLQGPELRIGRLDAPMTLTAGGHITLGAGGIPVAENILGSIHIGDTVLLDDGKIALEICSGGESSCEAAVIRGGLLQNRKSISVEGLEIESPTLTAEDLKNISEAGRYRVSAVMQPFVRGADDLRTVRKALDDAGCQDIQIFAKIENRTGVGKIDEIIPCADMIVIARGDLGNAVSLPALPAVQKQISGKCRAAGVPFMVVTQMLASMQHSPVPTRAEVSDIFNAVCDGASALMLTNETAAGEYPAEAVKYMYMTASSAESFLSGGDL